MTRFKNWGPGLNLLIYLTLGLALGSLVWSPKLQAQSWGHPKIIPIARPNPQDRGNCYQWKGCKGESIGAMPVDNPEFCGPLGGKSWKDFDGRCLDLKQGPWSADPPEGLIPTK